MKNSLSRRDFLKGACLAGVTLAAGLGAAWQPDDWIELLPVYAYSTRSNIHVTPSGRRAMLSGRLYMQGTYVRDAFYGPWALNDPALAQEAYDWFAESALPDGQIRTAVPFDPATHDLPPQDDDSALLFLIWSAVLARLGGRPALDVARRAWEWARARVVNGLYVSPAGPFRYWADTVAPNQPERIAHNQGLYVAALLALRELGIASGGVHALSLAARGYRACLHPAGYYALGQSSQFAACQDISIPFGEFLCRCLFDQPVLPDAALAQSLEHYLAGALVRLADGRPAGVKVICAADGGFLPPDYYFAPTLNRPGDYQNGGYWPMYTLVTLALDYRARPDPARRELIGALVTHELARDRISKEVMLLTPEDTGGYDPARSGYTWNALIPFALKWAGVV